MNILFAFFRLDGGAPLSALSYMKFLRAHGHMVYAAGTIGKEHIAEAFINAGVSLLPGASVSYLLSKHRYEEALRTYTQLYKMIAENEIDMVVSLQDRFVYGRICAHCNLPHIALVAGGTLRSKWEVRYWKADHVICFSPENLETLVGCGIKADDISVISNRIDACLHPVWRDRYEQPKAAVKMLAVSRLARGKTASLFTAINLTERLNQDGVPVTLDIAGDGNAFEMVRTAATGVNHRLGTKTVWLLGYHKDIGALANDYDIVCGKGRSVLEPIMTGRIGVVIGEDEKVCVHTEGSFSNLYYYNYSGRNIALETTYKEFKQLMLDILNGTVDGNTLEKDVEIVRRNYHTDSLEVKLNTIVAKTILMHGCCRRKKGLAASLLWAVVLYVYMKVSGKVRCMLQSMIHKTRLMKTIKGKRADDE